MIENDFLAPPQVRSARHPHRAGAAWVQREAHPAGGEQEAGHQFPAGRRQSARQTGR